MERISLPYESYKTLTFHMQDVEVLNGQDGGAFNEPKRCDLKRRFTILYLASILITLYCTGVPFPLRADHTIFFPNFRDVFSSTYFDSRLRN